MMKTPLGRSWCVPGNTRIVAEDRGRERLRAGSGDTIARIWTAPGKGRRSAGIIGCVPEVVKWGPRKGPRIGGYNGRRAGDVQGGPTESCEQCRQARRAVRGGHDEFMKKDHAKDQVDADEILPEYDFSHARPNKYASRYAMGSNVVV